MENVTLVNINDREKIVVELPTRKGGKVELYTTVGIEEERIAREKYPQSFDKTHKDSELYSLELLKCAICDWNMAGDDGQKLEITIDNIKKLGLKDIIHITKMISPDPSDVDFVNKKKESI